EGSWIGTLRLPHWIYPWVEWMVRAFNSWLRRGVPFRSLEHLEAAPSLAVQCLTTDVVAGESNPRARNPVVPSADFRHAYCSPIFEQETSRVRVPSNLSH